MFVRGGKFFQSVQDKTLKNSLWSTDDYARCAMLEARWRCNGVSEEECLRLLPCAVNIRKWPGTKYSDDIMKRLQDLFIEHN